MSGRGQSPHPRPAQTPSVEHELLSLCLAPVIPNRPTFCGPRRRRLRRRPQRPCELCSCGRPPPERPAARHSWGNAPSMRFRKRSSAAGRVVAACGDDIGGRAGFARPTAFRPTARRTPQSASRPSMRFRERNSAAGRRGSSEDDLPLPLNRAPDLGDGRGLNPSPDEHRPAARQVSLISTESYNPASRTNLANLRWVADLVAGGRHRLPSSRRERDG